MIDDDEHGEKPSNFLWIVRQPSLGHLCIDRGRCRWPNPWQGADVVSEGPCWVIHCLYISMVVMQYAVIIYIYVLIIVLSCIIVVDVGIMNSRSRQTSLTICCKCLSTKMLEISDTDGTPRGARWIWITRGVVSDLWEPVEGAVGATFTWLVQQSWLMQMVQWHIQHSGFKLFQSLPKLEYRLASNHWTLRLLPLQYKPCMTQLQVTPTLTKLRRFPSLHVWSFYNYIQWFNMIQYDSIWFNMIQYDSIWFNMIQYDSMINISIFEQFGIQHFWGSPPFFRIPMARSFSSVP